MESLSKLVPYNTITFQSLFLDEDIGVLIFVMRLFTIYLANSFRIDKSIIM